MVWIFLTRCCSYDSQTWTMETLLGAYAFLLHFWYTTQIAPLFKAAAAKTWNFVAVVVFFLLLNVLSFGLLFFFFILYSHTFLACRIALSCFLQWYLYRMCQVFRISVYVCVCVCVRTYVCCVPCLTLCMCVYVSVNACMRVVWQAQICICLIFSRVSCSFQF